MRSSRCSILPLWMQRRFELDAPQRATRILRRSASRAEPQEPESSCPCKRHRSSGPAGHEKRAGRKNGAKVNVTRSRERARTVEACASRSLLFALSSPSCHPRCVRDGMESHSRACTHPHRGPPRRAFARRRLGFRSDCSPAKENTFPKTEVLFTVGIE